MTVPLSNIFFSIGPEAFLLQDFIHQTKKAYIQKYGDFAVSSFSFPQSSFSQIRAEIMSPAFLSDKKIVFVEGLPWGATTKIDDDDKNKIIQFITDLKNVSSETAVYFYAVNPDKRTKAFKMLVSLVKELKEYQTWHTTKEKSKYIDWILEKTSRGGSVISRTNADFLLQFSGFSLSSLSTEIEKLSILRLGENITKEDIIAISVPSEEGVNFAFSNALSSASLPVILQELNTLFSDFSSAEVFNRDIIPPFRNLLKASFSLQGEQMGLNPFVVTNFSTALKKYSLSTCISIFSMLKEIDVGTKNGKYSLSADSRTFIVALESMIAKTL